MVIIEPFPGHEVSSSKRPSRFLARIVGLFCAVWGENFFLFLSGCKTQSRERPHIPVDGYSRIRLRRYFPTCRQSLRTWDAMVHTYGVDMPAVGRTTAGRTAAARAQTAGGARFAPDAARLPHPVPDRYWRISAPVDLLTLATSFSTARSTSWLVRVCSSERNSRAKAMDFLPGPTRTGSR